MEEGLFFCYPDREQGFEDESENYGRSNFFGIVATEPWKTDNLTLVIGFN